MTTEQREAIKTLSDTNILMNIQRDTALSIRLSIETVLALIKEQSAELLQKNAEIEKKDKQIDLMTEIFYKRFKAELLLEYGFENEEQLKQYFERKVEDEK